jgi:hypothetical protein
MRICIIGNSHIACVREAWSDDFDKTKKVTFFGSHANTILNTKNDHNIIKPTDEKVKNNFMLTSNGLNQIVLDDFDIIAIHGLITFPSGFKGYLNNLKSEVFYSSQALEKSNPFFNSTCGHIVNEIRKTSKIPIFVSPRPLPADKNIHKNIIENEFKMLEELAISLLKCSDAIFLLQNDNTKGNYRSTKALFTKNSKRLNPGSIHGSNQHPEDDVYHMNKDFGKCYLENLFQSIEQIIPYEKLHRN